MSLTTPSQGTHFSDGVRTGPIIGSSFVAGTNVLTPSRMVSSPIDQLAPGIFNTPLSLFDIIPAPVDTNNIATAQLPAAAGYLNLVTTNTTGISVITYNSIPNVIKLDCARNITITGSGGTTSQNFTIFGWDEYGMPLVERFGGPTGATTAIGTKAFLYIRAIYVAAGTVANVSIGVGNTFGLPFLVTSGNYIFSVMWDGKATSSFSASLNDDTLATTNNSSVITVTVPSTASLTTGQVVKISGAEGFNGLTASQLNISAPITVVDGTTFTYFALVLATGTGAGGGKNIIASTFVPGAQITATAITGDTRGTFTFSDMNDVGVDYVANGLSRLTINFYNASGDARNYNAASNGTLTLINNPLYVETGSEGVMVTAPNHQLTEDEIITISGATDTNGITAAQLNISARVSIVDENTFTYVSQGVATSRGNGGGSNATITPGLGNLYQTTRGRFGVPQYSIALF
jgi:hypothetical protein